MINERQPIQSILNFIVNVILYIISAVIFFSLCTFCAVYRAITEILIKLQYKEATMLNGMDSIIAYGKDADATQLMYTHFCSGTVDIDLFRLKFYGMVKDQPKLKCYLKQKYGYSFWLPDKNFNINEHVIYRSDLCITSKEELEQVQNTLYYQMPMREDSSPWRIQIVPYKSDKEETSNNFYLLLVANHCLGDGYSGMYTYLKNLADNEEPRLMHPYAGRPSLLQEILIILQGIVLVPSFLLQYLFPKPDLLICSKKTERQIVSELGIFKTEAVANVKRTTGVPFFVVLLTCMMGALENFFLKSKRPMPREITVSVPHVLWKPSDEIKICNNFVPAYLTLPFSKKSGIDRMKEINKIIKNFQTRARYIMNYALVKALSAITPNFVGRWICNGDDNSVMFSIAAIERMPSLVLGQRRIQDNTTRILPLVGNVRILFQTVTVGKEVTLSIHAKSTIISKDDLDAMVKYFVAELESLKSHFLIR